MKTITYIFIFLITSLGYSQVIFDFEGAPPTFNDFNGSFTQVIANPDATGINTSANVAENTVPMNAAFAGVNIVVPIDITTNKFFRMDVWSPVANTPVLLKLEGGPNPPVERQANLTTTGAWEEIVFDFSSEGALTYDSVTVFMNFNVVDPNTQTYYWDNLEQYNPPPPPATIPLTFENQSVTFNDFNGSFTQVIANPDPTGINTTANVAENTVPGGAAFAGVNIPVPVDITTDKFFRMDVWSPLAGMPVLLKLEGGPNPPVERQATMTTTGAWEELIFDFSSEGALTYDSVTVFMNFNVVDPGTQTYYWDNLELFSPGPMLPFTHEGQPLTFNDFNGSFTQQIANPDATGINTTATVAENTVPGGAAFAGVNIPVNYDIATDKFFRMDVWSLVPNTPVLLKLENSATGVNTEIAATTTTTGAWEELVFDFSFEPALTFDSITIFMNFNVIDPNTQTYYWDNLEQFSPAPPAQMLPFTHEAQPLTFNDFNGSATQQIANPDPTGVNTTATVAENVVPGGAAFAGVNIVVDYDIATDKFFRMDVWSPVPNTPVLLKLENSATGVNTEIPVSTTTTGAWEELVFDFSFEPALTFDSITIFMNFNVIDPNTQTYYWDNLEQFSPPPPVQELPFTHEAQPLVFNDFNGSATQQIANPDPTGVNISATVAENVVPGGAAFAGVNIVVDYDIATDKYFRMDVWSPVPNTPVLLKLENSATGVNTEIPVNTTTTNAWEELVFDFSFEPALTFDSITIFMNFNVVDPNTQTYYWDNLEQFTPTVANDDCSGAIAISCGDSILGSTLDATDDTAVAPDCQTTTSAPGVWYVYQDTSGLATDILLSTCSANTDYDTKISVYTGDCSTPPLTCVAGNDDSPNCTNFQSEVEFQSDGNTTFYILVHGFSGDTGNFELSMTCTLVPPPNDMIENSIDVDEIGFPYTDPAVSMPAATTEAGTPAGCDNTGVNGVWYNFVAPLNGLATCSVTTPAGFTSVTFYDAPNETATEADLTLIDYFDNQCVPQVDASVPVVAGQAYYVYVANTDGVTDIVIDGTFFLGTNDSVIDGFSYYPNPASTTVTMNSVEVIESVSVFSILGQKVISQDINALNADINVSNLATGAYIMKVSVNGQIGTYKIIKQ